MPAFTINLPDGLYKAIKATAKNEFTSMAAVCRKIFSEHLTKQSKKKPAK